MSSPHELDPQRLDQILERLLTGVATPEEQAQVSRWMAADPRHAALVNALQEAHAQHHANDPQSVQRTDAAWQALQARIERTTVRPISDAPSIRRTTRRPRVAQWLQMAAVLAVAVTGATVWRARTADVVLSAPIGERVSTTLPDGSRMTLAAGSRARWPRRFGSGVRDVRLEGEAYFDVVHDTTQPFRVRVGDDVAEDVGTKFVVRAWPEIGGVEVAVEEGAVALGRERTAPTLLTAGDRGRAAPDGRVHVTHDGAARAAWAHGDFVFDSTTLAEALPALGRWYGVTLSAPQTMQDRRVTGRFNLLQLDPLIESLAFALDARVTRAGSIITLTPH